MTESLWLPLVGFEGLYEVSREAIRCTWASYTGHFRHASSHRLQQRIHKRYPWLADAVANKDAS